MRPLFSQRFAGADARDFPEQYKWKLHGFQLLIAGRAGCPDANGRKVTEREVRCFARRKWTRMRGMPPETFHVVSQPSTRAGQQILQLKGAFTSSASAVFVEAVALADAPRLILDLTEVPMVDSMAVGALVRAFVSCHKSGRKLALVGLNHRVHNVLHLTGIAPLFDTYATIAEAEAGLP
jgi:anti-anti-sigma factor